MNREKYLKILRKKNRVFMRIRDGQLGTAMFSLAFNYWYTDGFGEIEIDLKEFIDLGPL